MKIKKIFSDVSYIEPEIYKDDRGSFSEIFNEELFKKNNLNKLKFNILQLFKSSFYMITRVNF